MSRETDAVLEDIAFIRALAEQGRDVPPRGGWTMILSGLLFGSASLFQWLVGNRLVDLPPYSVNYGWVGAAAIFAVSLIIISTRRHTETGKASITRTARISLGVANYVLLFVFGYAMWRLNNPIVMELFGTTIFALVGGYWAVYSAVLERPQFRWMAALSFVAAVGLALLFDTPHFYLVNAIALFAFFVVPGVILVARTRRTAA